MSISRTKDYSKIAIYTRHGGAYDRGRADSYYHRPCDPHCYKAATYNSLRIEFSCLSEDEIAAYIQGYNDETERKDWGEDDYSCESTCD